MKKLKIYILVILLICLLPTKVLANKGDLVYEVENLKVSGNDLVFTGWAFIHKVNNESPSISIKGLNNAGSVVMNAKVTRPTDRDFDDIMYESGVDEYAYHDVGFQANFNLSDMEEKEVVNFILELSSGGYTKSAYLGVYSINVAESVIERGIQISGLTDTVTISATHAHLQTYQTNTVFSSEGSRLQPGLRWNTGSSYKIVSNGNGDADYVSSVGSVRKYNLAYATNGAVFEKGGGSANLTKVSYYNAVDTFCSNDDYWCKYALCRNSSYYCYGGNSDDRGSVIDHNGSNNSLFVMPYNTSGTIYSNSCNSSYGCAYAYATWFTNVATPIRIDKIEVPTCDVTSNTSSATCSNPSLCNVTSSELDVTSSLTGTITYKVPTPGVSSSSTASRVCTTKTMSMACSYTQKEVGLFNFDLATEPVKAGTSFNFKFAYSYNTSYAFNKTPNCPSVDTYAPKAKSQVSGYSYKTVTVTDSNPTYSQNYYNGYYITNKTTLQSCKTGTGIEKRVKDEQIQYCSRLALPTGCGSCDLETNTCIATSYTVKLIPCEIEYDHMLTYRISTYSTVYTCEKVGTLQATNCKNENDAKNICTTAVNNKIKTAVNSTSSGLNRSSVTVITPNNNDPAGSDNNYFNGSWSCDTSAFNNISNWKENEELKATCDYSFPTAYLKRSDATVTYENVNDTSMYIKEGNDDKKNGVIFIPLTWTSNRKFDISVSASRLSPMGTAWTAKYNCSVPIVQKFYEEDQSTHEIIDYNFDYRQVTVDPKYTFEQFEEIPVNWTNWWSGVNNNLLNLSKNQQRFEKTYANAPEYSVTLGTQGIAAINGVTSTYTSFDGIKDNGTSTLVTRLLGLSGKKTNVVGTESLYKLGCGPSNTNKGGCN